MSLKDGLKKSLFSLLLAGFVLVSINVAGAQVLSAIPGSGNVELGSIKVAPFAQVGYKNIGFNFNLPFTITPDGWTGPPPHDLKFRNAGVWVGSIGFDASLLSTFFLSLRADANASKNIDVIAGENYPWQDHPRPYTWRGSQLQWWDVDGMVGYTFFRDWSVVGGVRYDKLTVGLTDPVDATGTSFFVAGESIVFRQDIIVKTWIPYIGLQLNGTNYKASLIYSPFASPQVLAPQRWTNRWTVFGAELGEYDDDKYKFANTGSFLEGFFEYNVSIRESLLFGLWARGTWMKVTGNGELESQQVNTSPFPDETLFVSMSTTGTLSTYGLSGGISATLSF